MGPGNGGYATHEVHNQASVLADYNAFAGDVALQEAIAQFGGSWAEAALRECGALAGSARVQNLARLAGEAIAGGAEQLEASCAGIGSIGPFSRLREKVARSAG